MDAIGTPTTGRSFARRWVVAAVSVLLLVLAATAALAQEETEPIQPPEPVEAVGEVSCEPRTPVAGDTLTCTATGAEAFAELEVTLLLYSPAQGPDEEGVLWPWQEDVVPVEDGVATFAFVIVDQAVEGDEWEAYAWMIGGSRQDCFVIERETGQVVATGALEAEDAETFLVGGETFSWESFSLVCTDEIRFDAFDIGLIGAAPEPDEEPVPPDEEPVPSDGEPAPPAAEPGEVAAPDDAAEPVPESELTIAAPEDGSPLAATGAALLLWSLVGALMAGGGYLLVRR